MYAQQAQHAQQAQRNCPPHQTAYGGGQAAYGGGGQPAYGGGHQAQHGQQVALSEDTYPVRGAAYTGAPLSAGPQGGQNVCGYADGGPQQPGGPQGGGPQAGRPFGGGIQAGKAQRSGRHHQPVRELAEFAYQPSAVQPRAGGQEAGAHPQAAAKKPAARTPAPAGRGVGGQRATATKRSATAGEEGSASAWMPTLNFRERFASAALPFHPDGIWHNHQARADCLSRQHARIDRCAVVLVHILELL